MLLKVSIIVLNYNGLRWIDRCVSSLQAQTLAPSIEVIFADNASTDGSREYLENKIQNSATQRFLKIDKNIGYGGGCNEATRLATGKYLFFLNPDLWLEPDCIEQLYQAAESSGAGAASALVMNYDSNEPQGWGNWGFDVFGMGVQRPLNTKADFIKSSCSFLFIRTSVFKMIGEFDKELFLYNEEVDINLRLNIFGEKIINVPSAHIHHQGITYLPGTATPRSTSLDRRFHSNRSHLLTLLKIAHSIFFIFIINSLVLFFFEAIAGMLIWRRPEYFKRTFTDVLRDCWKLRHHISAERSRITRLSKSTDWALLDNFTWRLNRIVHLRDFLSQGLPKMR